jgi:septal ring factor EnvC (AmiA/AmiB activator)
MAEAIRAATLLGSTVEALKSETDALRADLAQLADLRASIAKQRDDLGQRSAALAADKTRLAALIDARQQSLTEAEQALIAQRERAAQLADQVTNLKDLIAKMETAGAADRANAADIAAKAAALRNADPARLKPAIAFADARGSLVLPVAGAVLKNFGDSDGFGGVEKGISIAAPPGATVSSPVDGSIVFAGPYRSYGQLLIINAGQGYYFVLAGMDRINVSVGQFVLAGEAVAAMGDGAARTAAAAAIGATQPVLYIELRKDETAVDSGPWWTKSDIEKARG